jgi:ribosomal protein S19E (S16A)
VSKVFYGKIHAGSPNKAQASYVSTSGLTASKLLNALEEDGFVRKEKVNYLSVNDKWFVDLIQVGNLLRLQCFTVPLFTSAD